LTSPRSFVITGGRAIRSLPNGPYWAYLFIIPSLVLVGSVVAYPMVTGLILSLQRYRVTDLVHQGEFVGLANFARLIADPVAQQATITTIIYVTAVVFGSLVLGLAAAALLFSSFKGISLVRLLILVPLFLPSVIASYTWDFLLDSRAGVINDILVRLGIIGVSIDWLSHPTTALIAVIVVDIWMRFPLFAIFLLAAMFTISEEIVEAAAVDGANGWDRFRRIKLPLLRPMIVIASVLVTISVAQSPDVIVVLTNGGPARATTTLSMYTFQQAFLNFDFGYAAAVGCLLLGLLSIFVIIYARASGLLRRG
jgi:multiple sugar transport system permease protein